MNYQLKPIRVHIFQDIESGEMYVTNNLEHFADEHNLRYGSLRQMLIGNIQKHKNFMFVKSDLLSLTA